MINLVNNSYGNTDTYRIDLVLPCAGVFVGIHREKLMGTDTKGTFEARRQDARVYQWRI